MVLQLQQAWQQPGVYDIRLLAYMYKLLAEATRRHTTTVCISGLGNENSKVWLSAAKSMGRRERQELWSALGRAAFGEECWEDFRFVCQHPIHLYKQLTTTGCGAIHERAQRWRCVCIDQETCALHPSARHATFGGAATSTTRWWHEVPDSI